MDDRIAGDERFSKVFTDARFRGKKSKNKARLKVDDRFTGGGVAAEELQRYYDIQQNQEEEQEASKYVDYSAAARGEVSLSSSEDSSSSSEDEELDAEDLELQALLEKEGEIGLGVRGDVVEEGEATSRLALVGLDWSRVSAVDLYALLSSFCPTEGDVKRVTVYVSNYGQERMAYEELNGPLLEAEEGDTEQMMLRRYELSRLRYYFAIAETDSVRTASALYATCDGAEYGRSSNFLDLRFVPDDMTELDDMPVRDSATSVPANYRAPDFETAALQHTKVELNWDLTPASRLAVTTRTFQEQNEWDDDDFAAYLASSYSSDEDADADDQEEELRFEGEERDDEERRERAAMRVRERYQALLSDGEDDEGEEEDMEISFLPAIVDPATLEDEKHMTHFEKQVAQGKRKRKERKRLAKQQQQEEEQAAGGKKRDSNEQARASEADLELLVMGNKKKKARSDKEERVDIVGDARFAELWEDPKYGIDPTDQRFKETAAMGEAMVKVRERISSNTKHKKGKKKKKKKGNKSLPEGSRSIQAMVDSLKKYNGVK